MYRTPPFVLPVAVLLPLLLIGCSSPLPRVETSPSYLLELRAEYLAMNPDGEFNVHVEQGEVVKGMDYLAVLASWGYPTRRERRGETREDWVYREVDETTQAWIEYTFIFRHNVLGGWDIARNSAGGRGLETERRDDVLTRDASTGGKQVPTDY